MRKKIMAIVLTVLFCLPIGGMAMGEDSVSVQLEMWAELSQWLLTNADATRYILAADVTAEENGGKETTNLLASIEKNTDGGLQLRIDLLENNYVSESNFIQVTDDGLYYKSRYDDAPVFVALPETNINEWNGDEMGAAIALYINDGLVDDLPVIDDVLAAAASALLRSEAVEDAALFMEHVAPGESVRIEMLGAVKALEDACGALSANVKLLLKLEELKLFDALGVPKSERRVYILQAIQGLQQMLRSSNIAGEVKYISLGRSEKGGLQLGIGDDGENAITLEMQTEKREGASENQYVDDLRLTVLSPYESFAIEGKLNSTLSMDAEGLSLVQYLVLGADSEEMPISFRINLNLMVMKNDLVDPIVSGQTAQDGPEPTEAPLTVDDAYVFQDAAVEQAVRNVLDRYNEPLTVEDLLYVTMLDLSGAGVQSLTDLSYMENLMFLYLNDNGLTDEDMSALSGLTSLMSISLSGNQLTNTDALAGLTTLNELTLDDNPLRNIDGLAGLTNMGSLSISGLIGDGGITDCGAVKDMTNLYLLSLSFNSIEDLSPLVELTNLTSLFLTSNRIVDLSPLNGMTKLATLYLSGNLIEDASPIQHLMETDCNIDLSGNPVYEAQGE